MLMVLKKDRQKENDKNNQAKEFVREWLIANNFMGKRRAVCSL
jgi:hypothetical protein